MASPIAASPEFTALQAHAAEVKQGTSVGEMVKDQHFLPILARRRQTR